MKGLRGYLRQVIGERKRVDADILSRSAMRSNEVDEKDDDFRLAAYRSGIVSYLNDNDFYATGDGIYTHISAMTAEELKRKRDQLFDTAQSILGTVSQMDGQLSMMIDGTIHVPEPVKVYEG